jgi:cytochrome c
MANPWSPLVRKAWFGMKPTFVAYVADPKDFLKSYLDDKKAKSKMAFKLKDAEDQANVWAYLVSVAE